MQHIADRFDSKRGVKKAIQRRKPWFTGPLEDRDQNSTLVAGVEDFSNRFTIINKMATDKVDEPFIVIETEQTKAKDHRSSAEKEKSKVENKEFYKNMFKAKEAKSKAKELCRKQEFHVERRMWRPDEDQYVDTFLKRKGKTERKEAA